MSVQAIVAADREHAEELRHVFPTWIRWHPELFRFIFLVDESLDYSYLPIPDHPMYSIIERKSTQRDTMLWALLVQAPYLVSGSHWLKIDTDTVATGPGPPLTDYLDGVESIAACPWGYSKPVDAITQLDTWYGAITGEPPLEGVTYRPDGHSRERERCYYPRVIGWITIINTAFSRRVAEFLVEHPPPFISHDTLLWYLAERWKIPAKKIKFRKLGWDHRLGLRSIKEKVAEVMAC